MFYFNLSSLCKNKDLWFLRNVNLKFCLGIFIYFFIFICFFFFFFFIYIGLVFNLYDFCLIFEYNFYSFNSLFFCYLIVLDWVSLMFISIVLLISSLVILYSSVYIGLIRYSYIRFLIILLIFILRIILMIIRPNIIRIILGWDGLGLVSYYLVIYYRSLRSYVSGIVTCLINRLGDGGLLVSIVWLISYGSWNFMYYLDFFYDYIFYLIVLSCFTKSAQVPFSSWLPAAIAAPTPISALVHSSTLVTAGIYLIIRFNYFFKFNSYFFFYLGLITMFMSSYRCIFEYDLKKIIAISTLSQLGLIICSLFFCNWIMSFFHLLRHAVFKSLLFLCAGIIIYYINDNQDIRLIGSVCSFLPFTCSCMNISNLCLCGFPFLSGFYSKDLILDNFFLFNFNFYCFFFMYICLGLTCFYRFRLFYYSIIYNYNFYSFFGIFESLSFISFRVFFLTFFSIFFSCIMIWLFRLNFRFIFLPFYLKLFPFFILLISYWFSFEFVSIISYFFGFYYYFFNGNIWFISSYFNYMYFYFYNFSLKNLMVLRWGEFFGPFGLSYYFLIFSSFIQFRLLNLFNFIMFSFFIWLFFFI